VGLLSVTRTQQENALKRICKLTSGSVALALVLATLSTSSFALGSAEQRAACMPDAMRLCSSQIPNISAIVACLRQNRASLSKPCQAAMNSPLGQSIR
jgi:hypothetical protein